MAEVEFDEWDAAAGLIVPVLVEVPDGFYEQRVVLDEQLVAGFVPEGETMPERALAYHYEPCRIPRYRQELRWHEAL